MFLLAITSKYKSFIMLSKSFMYGACVCVRVLKNCVRCLLKKNKIKFFFVDSLVVMATTRAVVFKKQNVYERSQAPTKDGKLPPQHELRRARFSLRERRKLVNFAFDVVDPEHTGKITREKLDDLANEIAYLIRFCSSEEDERERQRSLCSLGDEKMKAMDKEDELGECHQESTDIHSESSEDEFDNPDSEDNEDDNTSNFIATEEEIQLEIHQSKQLQITYQEKEPQKKRRRLKKQTLVVGDDVEDLD